MPRDVGERQEGGGDKPDECREEGAERQRRKRNIWGGWGVKLGEEFDILKTKGDRFQPKGRAARTTEDERRSLRQTGDAHQVSRPEPLLAAPCTPRVARLQPDPLPDDLSPFQQNLQTITGRSRGARTDA